MRKHEKWDWEKFFFQVVPDLSCFVFPTNLSYKLQLMINKVILIVFGWKKENSSRKSYKYDFQF